MIKRNGSCKMDLNQATLKELVEFYNTYAGQPIKKFRDRATALRRCTALQSELPQHNSTLAEGVARSWQDPDVAAKRKQRNAVLVDGQSYRSVREAFDLLGLPMKEHIKFRMTLKERGKMGGYGHTWVIMKR